MSQAQQHRTSTQHHLAALVSTSLLALSLIACNSAAYEAGRTAGKDAAASSAAVATSTPTAAPQSHTITGSGKKVEGPIPLQSGLVRVSMKYSGDHNFIVRLIDDQGKSAAGLDSLLANSVGAWEGEKAVRLEKTGGYLLDVTGEGTWDITLTQ